MSTEVNFKEDPTNQVIADQAAATTRVTDAIEACKTLNGLAAIGIPKVMTFLFPKLFIYFWSRCVTLAHIKKGFPQLALGIPRGHGKTIFLKLLIVYIILFTHRKFILVVCASQTLADAVLTDVVSILGSKNIRTIFGNYDEEASYDRKDGKMFKFRGRTIILKARGQGSSFRGVNEDFARPDTMIFDDAQTKECAESVTQAKEFIEWFRGTALKAKSSPSTFFLYVGNMYRKVVIKEAEPERGIMPIYGCNLKNLKESPYWESIIVGALLENGEALWEELQPVDQLLAEYEQDKQAGVEEVFLAEVMNDDEAFNTRLFNPALVPQYPYLNAGDPEGNCFIIDPSLGKKKSDSQVVGKLEVFQGNACLTDLRTYQVSAPKLVQDLLQRCIDENVGAIAIENYAYQESLADWFEFFMDEMGLEGINILLVNRGAQSKNYSIQSMFKECMESDYHGSCELYLHPSVRHTLYSEIKTFDPLKSDNTDDNLDVASYCTKVKLEHSMDILSPIYESITYQRSRVVDTGMQY